VHLQVDDKQITCVVTNGPKRVLHPVGSNNQTNLKTNSQDKNKSVQTWQHGNVQKNKINGKSRKLEY
jgi:hypothetical protein